MVTTESGVTLHLKPSQVKEAIRKSSVLVEYERLSPSFADTVEDQWELAEWCHHHRLPSHRKQHLQRILQMDPHHLAARRALGYSFIADEWVTSAEWMSGKGYLYYEGRWRLPQEIQLIEECRTQEREVRQWNVRLRRWRDAGARAERRDGAVERFRAVRDPAAVSGLHDMLQRETLRHWKAVYIDALSGIAGDTAVATLIACSLDDPDEEIRWYCMQQIRRIQPATAVTDYVRALQDVDNRRVQRAAIALALLDDGSSVGPLIEALMTRHVLTLPGEKGRSADSVSTTFSSDGPGLVVGDQSRRMVQVFSTQEVLDALIQLTDGVNFHYDQASWRAWHESQLQGTSFNARR